MNSIHAKDLKRGQQMYIYEAALEYLISILVAGSFLATITNELGLSDSLTGILSSVISLGCLFQMLSIFIHRKHLKGFVMLMSIINQLLFLLLYVIPVFDIPSAFKTVLFVVSIFTAYLIYNVAHPKKINWLMSLIDDSYRGRFTANKEIFSLITGMIFSYSMGALVDHFKALGQMKTAFLLSAAVIFILMLLHTATMFFTPEPSIPEAAAGSILKNIKRVLSNKNIVHVTFLFVLYYISTYVATPFYSTYMIHELSFSLKLISVLGILSSIVRIIVSRFWGSYADKTSFSNMIQKCLLVLAGGYLCASFAAPSNGLLMFALYYVLHGAALGGINSALTNLIFDYVPPAERADSLAISQATSGLAGFVTTLITSIFVSYIQNNGNQLLGFQIYAQQAGSMFACIIVLAAVIYVRKVISKQK